MRRAYSPRLSTVHLADDVRRLPGVQSVRIVAPTGGMYPRPARLRIILTGDASGMTDRSVYVSMATARAMVRKGNTDCR